MRVDNGKPWGSWSDLPPAPGVVADRPGGRRDLERPAAAATERRGGAVAGDGQAVGGAARLRQPGGAAGPPGRRRPAAAGAVSRRRGTQPLGAVPGSRAQRPPYREADEAGAWCLGRVRDHLAEWAVPRRVDSQGKVSIYNRNIYVGVLYAGRDVWVQFDPGHGEWLINDGGGQQLRARPAPEIDAESIRGLRLSGRK